MQPRGNSFGFSTKGLDSLGPFFPVSASRSTFLCGVPCWTATLGMAGGMPMYAPYSAAWILPGITSQTGSSDCQASIRSLHSIYPSSHWQLNSERMLEHQAAETARATNWKRSRSSSVAAVYGMSQRVCIHIADTASRQKHKRSKTLSTRSCTCQHDFRTLSLQKHANRRSLNSKSNRGTSSEASARLPSASLGRGPRKLCLRLRQGKSLRSASQASPV